jgi:hypothetical protein
VRETMKDTELDELLNCWKVPSPPVELREQVRGAFYPPRKRRSLRFNLKPMFAGTALGACVGLLAIVTQAFPQTIRIASGLFQIPYTVDSEFVNFDEYGTPKVEMYATSYMDKGVETQLSSSVPGEPFATAVRRVLDATGFLLSRIVRRDHSGYFVGSGCVNQGQPVVERKTLLGFPTVAIQTRFGGGQERMTLWMAPDLDCFALMTRDEERQADGSYRVVSEKHALSVTWTTVRQSSR